MTAFSAAGLIHVSRRLVEMMVGRRRASEHLESDIDHCPRLDFREFRVAKALIVPEGVKGRDRFKPVPLAKVNGQVDQGPGLRFRESDIEKPPMPLPSVVSQHGLQSPLNCRFSMKHVAREFHAPVGPVQTARLASLAAALSLVLLLALADAGHAQASRPIGANPDGPPDLRASLGECRDDLLRDAWNDILPLEAEAVEREVLALCTERAEAIARFLAAQERLDRALAERRAAAVNAEPGPDDARMTGLRGDIAELRARIARLERQPEGPGSDAALADLRDELATAEAQLERLEGDGSVSGPSDVPPPVAAVTDAGEDEPSATEIAPPPPGDQAADSLPPPGTDPTGETPVPTAEAAPVFPSEGPAEWRVVHAVRRDGGPWQVRLQADRMTPIPIPGATPEAPDTFIFRPVSDPPVTVAVGDVLPDGLELLAVTSEGVELGDPGDPVADPVLLLFATAGDSEPGALEWDVHVLEGADQ